MTQQPPNEPPRDELVLVNIEDQMKDAYIDYAMSVIIGRALPDVRDGLKPVHRRILYTMADMSLGPDKPFRKSAKVVGDVMGRFHPHGDSAIYDTMVRMAQDFTMRYPQVQGHGNFGSIDGDNAAAMRYTEVRMAKISVDMVADIKMNTVDFQDSYDGSEQEPTVLPSRIPTLLVNGSDGIAVGMATKIPPHNLKEVVNGCIALIDDPELDVSGLMKYVKGPDFPTYGEILGKSGIRDAYETGRGKLVIRGKNEIEEMKSNRPHFFHENLFQVFTALLLLFQNIGHGRVHDEFSLVDQAHAVTQHFDIRQDVGTEEHGFSAFLEPENDFAEHAPADGVKAAHGLVQHHKVRVIDEGLGQAHALEHAFAVLAQGDAQFQVQAELLGHFGDAPVQGRAVQGKHAAAHGQGLPPREVWVDGRVLGKKAHAFAHAPVRVAFAQDCNLAGSGAQKTHGDLDARGFSGPVGSQEPEYLTLVHLEVQAVNSHNAPVASHAGFVLFI